MSRGGSDRGQMLQSPVGADATCRIGSLFVWSDAFLSAMATLPPYSDGVGIDELDRPNARDCAARGNSEANSARRRDAGYGWLIVNGATLIYRQLRLIGAMQDRCQECP
ncbi:hypothetical protein [Pseudaminobacter salicylatoxidans]|uniref:hypothetical protein n=1 Tax=Pseudaminobacter salicylatoxidans TaxID=93369 RepID=UPI0011B1EB35|nr:hypothetical protein [Pseudaminobacter salicylatoxidans]